MVDYYSILSLDPSCSQEDVKTAYRRLAKKYHPDVNKGRDAAEKFRLITEAYEHIMEEKSGSERAKKTEKAMSGPAGFSLAGIFVRLNDPDPYVRRNAIEDLGSRACYNNQTVINTLIRLLGSDNAMIRRAATSSLGKIGNPVAIPHIGRMLNENWTHIRLDAAIALDEIGGLEGLEYLERMDMSDPDNTPRVKEAVREAIFRIKKANGMEDTSVRCPYCGGRDVENPFEPFLCKACGALFWKRTGKARDMHEHTGARKSHDNGASCECCGRQLEWAVKCKYCGRTFCCDHWPQAVHDCYAVADKPGRGNLLQNIWDWIAAKREKAIAILLLCFYIFIFITSARR